MQAVTSFSGEKQSPSQITEEWYQALFQTATQPMFFYDCQTLTFLDVNQAAINCYGYTYDEFLRMTIYDLRPAQEAHRIHANLSRMVSEPIQLTSVLHVTKDGDPLWVEIKSHPVMYNQRSAVFATVNNLTILKETERRLQDISLQYESLFLNHPDIILIFDLEGRFIRANNATTNIIGYEANTLVGEHFAPYVHPDDRCKAQTLFYETALGKSARQEVRAIHREGHILTFDVTGIPIIVDGQLVGVYGILRDVTEKRAMEASLRKKSEQLQNALQVASMVMWEWRPDTDALVTWGNLLSQRDPNEAAGWKATDYLRLFHEEDRSEVETTIRRTASENTSYSVEARLLCADADTRWVEIRGYPAGYANQRQIVVGFTIDVTRRKQAEMALHRSHRELKKIVVQQTSELRKANRNLKILSAHLQSAREEERTHFAREIHDELGGILAAIKYDLAMTNGRNVQPSEERGQKNEHAMALVDSAINSLRNIIANLRPTVLDDLGLWAALEWLTQEFRERHAINCQYELYGEEVDVPSSMSVAIFRITQELLTNIARHARATSATIQVDTSDSAIHLRIQDNGVGISRQQMISNRSYGILGVKERVRYFNGSVRFYGKKGRGTTVNLQFPLKVQGDSQLR